MYWFIVCVCVCRCSYHRVYIILMSCFWFNFTCVFITSWDVGWICPIGVFFTTTVILHLYHQGLHPELPIQCQSTELELQKHKHMHTCTLDIWTVFEIDNYCELDGHTWYLVNVNVMCVWELGIFQSSKVSTVNAQIHISRIKTCNVYKKSISYIHITMILMV